MGEEEASGFLMRSLSQPSPISCQFKEGDPLRALTTSISFGRFMKEPLDWEKWSSFTHNRNLEEVEKYSKPGSVAAKKAYFEAHYKKIAAKKKAAASLEQENEEPNRSPEPNPTNEVLCNSSINSDSVNEQENDGAQANPRETNPTTEIPNNSSLDSNLEKSDSLVEVSRASIELVSSVHSNECNVHVEPNEFSITGKEQLQALPEEVVEVNTHCITETERSQADLNVDLLNQSENIENHCEITAIQAETTLLNEDATNHGGKGLSTKKRPAVPTSKPSVNNGAPKLRAPVKSSIPVYPRKEDSATSNTKKVGRELIERKRLTPQSLHMSINFGSSARESTKRSSPVPLHKNGNAKIPKTVVKTTKERDTRQAPIRASVTGEVSKHSSIIPQHENRRSRTPHDRSTRESRTLVGKSLSLSIGHSESSVASAKKPKPPTVFSSFVLRSEERAAKRKEFFQKLEEKVNAATETVNIQRQTKSKIPPTRPRSPNLGKKPSSSPSKVQNTSSRPLRGSTFTKTDHSKNFIERNKLNLTRSVTSLPKKKVSENASPNIQL